MAGSEDNSAGCAGATCPVCGGIVPQRKGVGRPRRHCSSACTIKAGRAAEKLRIQAARADRKAKPPSVIAAECSICGDAFSYAVSRNGRPRMFCSTACRVKAMRAHGARYRAEGRYAPRPRNMDKHKRDCAICGDVFSTDNSRTITCGAVCGKMLSDWSRSVMAGLRRFERFGANLPAQIAYYRRRGAWLRAGEKVDPIAVFERDGWRCHLCGRPTPKKLRGTTDDRAPELDHVLPLSRGGEHTYANTACACRRCNSLKGAKPAGQLPLFANPGAALF